MSYFQVTTSVDGWMANLFRFDLADWRGEREDEIPLRFGEGDWEMMALISPSYIGLVDKVNWEEAEYLLEDKEEFGSVTPELKELLSRYTWEEYIKKSIDEDDGTLLEKAQKYLVGEVVALNLYY